ncbi:hypothetical protein GCM10010466_60090 [Planomonospora alba]|uniref:Uncharacterized protein n=1 Tax=Planomonospora alba TaxID=161354 RepID=A0ABP6NXF6_9ACTN
MPNRQHRNFAIAELGTNGKITLHNDGEKPITVSVNTTGYFTTALDQGQNTSTIVPGRLAAGVTIPANGEHVLSLLGKAGLPAARPSAVGLAITASGSGAGAITVNSSGVIEARAEALSYEADIPVTTFMTPRVGCDGVVILRNTGEQPVTVDVDAYAYFGDAAPPSAAPSGVAGDIEKTTGTADLADDVTSDPVHVEIASCTDDLGTSTTSIPNDGSKPVAVTTLHGAVSIGMPASGAATASEAGTAVFNGDDAGYSAAVQPTDDGGFRALVHIEDASAPTSFDFPVTMPEGMVMVLNDDGSVGFDWKAEEMDAYFPPTEEADDPVDPQADFSEEIGPAPEANEGEEAPSSQIISDTLPVPVIKAPWARDATGRTWPSKYSVNGSTLTLMVDLTPVQTSDQDATLVEPTFPVVADPQVQPRGPMRGRRSVCTFKSETDRPHESTWKDPKTGKVGGPEASAHGWWENINCPNNLRADVTVWLEELLPNGTWIKAGTVDKKRLASKKEGGGRATGRARCNKRWNTTWRSFVDVDIVGYADTPGTNMKEHTFPCRW